MNGIRMMTLTALLALPGIAHGQASGVQPGQWEIAVTVQSIDMPGAPPGIAQMMAGKTTKVKHCITPEEASRGPQDMLKSNKSCSFTRYSMAGGKLSSQMVCKQSGGTMTATSTGSFTPTSFTANGRSVTTGGGMPMTVTATTVGKRIGDCRK